MATKKASQPFKVGDRVRIRQSVLRGRIVEERGPLGPGGMLIYRVRIPRKPKSAYIEVRADQLVLSDSVTPPKAAPSPFVTHSPSPLVKSNGKKA